ncbi:MULTISPECIES: hypothetical protein [Pantoea]|uniref:hypothetical protein n=1 Tax=Pantoea TaxID=53335 RepID=UPI0024B7DBAC|nr:hypothetical protein [Pantoea dispersa]MDI9766784.1 hypothetical protein [Pantoea dispersa]
MHDKNAGKVRDSSEITKITFDMIKYFFQEIEHKHGESECSFCHSTTWHIHKSPYDPSNPNVVTFPMPFSPGIGMWAFPIACADCGDMKFFEASKVYDFLKSKGKL